MTNVLTVEGKEYVPATEAGLHFGYTKDYVLMLIKQGKIDGKKIGQKWYANLPSGEAFFKAAQSQRDARHKKISSDRKAELKVHTQVRTKTHSKSALLETLVIVIIGLSLGASGYIGTTSNMSASSEGDYSFFQNLALSFYTFVSPEKVLVTSHIQATSAEQTAISAHVGTTTYTSLVVAPDELFTATTIESIQDSFSDEVEVSIDPENPQTGIITPVFKETKGEAYRFLMVPVNEQTQ